MAQNEWILGQPAATHSVYEWALGLPSVQTEAEAVGEVLLTGSLAATSSVAATLETTKLLVGTVSAQSTVTGALPVDKKLAGSIAALSGISGTVNMIWRVNGSIASDSGVVGEILRVRSIAGSVQAQSDTTSLLRCTFNLAGGITAQSDLSGSIALGGVIQLVGTIEGTSGLLGTVRLSRAFTGLLEGASGLSGTLRRVRGFGGLLEGSGGLSGSLTGVFFLRGGIEAVSTVIATLRILGVVTVQSGTLRPSKVLAEYLIQQGLFTRPSDGLEWPLFTRNIPDWRDVPDSIAILYDTTGVVDARNMHFREFERHGLQLRVRAISLAVASEKIAGVTDVLKLLAMVGVVVDERVFSIKNIGRTTTIVPLGRDDNSREHLVTNFLMSYSET